MAKRGRPEKLTYEKTMVLVELHGTGRTYKALAAERKMSYATVNAALKRHGVTDKQLKARFAPVSVQLVA